MSTQFSPISGKLGQLIFESPDSGLLPRLEFFIELEFQEAEIDGELVKPFFRASNIVVEAKSWKDLENLSHEFPWAPKLGSIEAAMVLFGEQNPADVGALNFGGAEAGKLSVSFETEVDFEIEADRDELGQIELSFSDFPLEIAPLKIATSLAKRCEGDPEAISKAISEIIDSSVYGAVSRVPGGFELPING